jgi:hypothetical protein
MLILILHVYCFIIFSKIPTTNVFKYTFIILFIPIEKHVGYFRSEFVYKLAPTQPMVALYRSRRELSIALLIFLTRLLPSSKINLLTCSTADLMNKSSNIPTYYIYPDAVSCVYYSKCSRTRSSSYTDNKTYRISEIKTNKSYHLLIVEFFVNL